MNEGRKHRGAIVYTLTYDMESYTSLHIFVQIQKEVHLFRLDLFVSNVYNSKHDWKLENVIGNYIVDLQTVIQKYFLLTLSIQLLLYET